MRRFAEELVLSASAPTHVLPIAAEGRGALLRRRGSPTSPRTSCLSPPRELFPPPDIFIRMHLIGHKKNGHHRLAGEYDS